MANVFEEMDKEPSTGGNVFAQMDRPSASDIATDVAKSAAIGVPKAAIGWAGFPEQLADWGGRGARALFGESTPTFLQREQDPAMRLPSTEEIRSAVEKRTGQLYEPQTLPGQFAQTATEFATGPRAGMVGRAVTGLASEAAGQLTAGTEAEPYARIGTALAGGVVQARRASGAAQVAAIENAPEQIEKGAKALYKALDEHGGIPIDMGQRSQYGELMRQDLNRRGIRDFGGGEIAHKAVSNFISDTRNLGDMVAWRQAIKNLYEKGEGAAANILTNVIDQAIDRFSPVGVGVLKEADHEWSLARMSESLNDRFEKLTLQTAAANSGANLDNKIRQALTALRTNERAMSGFTPQERIRIENVIAGGVGVNLLRKLSNLLGGGGGLGAFISGTMGSILTGHPLGFGLFPAIGASFKSLENAIQRSRVRKLQAEVAGRSQLEALRGGPLYRPPLGADITRGAVIGLPRATFERPPGGQSDWQ